MKTERELALDCLRSLWLKCELHRQQARDNAIKSEDNGEDHATRCWLRKYKAWIEAKNSIAKHVKESFGVNIEKYYPTPVQVRGRATLHLLKWASYGFSL